jgi:hypothetical protein
MDIAHVVAQFQEWHLATALDRKGVTDPAGLWKRPVVRTSVTAAPTSFATLFRADDRVPIFTPQLVLTLPDATRYGIEEDYFKKTFWGLRPDFALQVDSLTVFLEAKGRAAPLRTWTDPKEKLYYRFLSESSVIDAGFFSVIPASLQAKCEKCLAQHFRSVPKVHSGFIVWEDVLEFLAPELLEVAVDELVHVSKGLQNLRAWQIERRQRAVVSPSN